MFLNVNEAPRVLPGSVVVSDILSELYRDDRSREEGNRIRLLCLKNGLRSDDLMRGMSSPFWALDLIQEFRSLGGDGWLISTSALKDRSMSPSDFPLVARAAGVDGEPNGNARCTLPIRRYDERQSQSGGLEWLEALIDLNSASGGIVQPLLKSLRGLIQSATENGAGLYVEQITVVIAKDAKANNTCLTPRLHADEYYGWRETAVASLLETGWSDTGGTWFLPASYMPEFPDGDAIKPADFTSRRFANIPTVYSGNGDVCIYDGMLDMTGKANPSLGLPHISGDLPGKSSRLVILMNHIWPGRSPS